MKKELHLVLGFDSTDELQKTIQEIVVKQARLIYANALIAHAAVNDGSTKPEIHLYSDDFLSGKEDIGVPATVAEAQALTQRVPADGAEADEQANDGALADADTKSSNQFGDEE